MWTLLLLSTRSTVGTCVCPSVVSGVDRDHPSLCKLKFWNLHWVLQNSVVPCEVAPFWLWHNSNHGHCLLEWARGKGVHEERTCATQIQNFASLKSSNTKQRGQLEEHHITWVFSKWKFNSNCFRLEFRIPPLVLRTTGNPIWHCSLSCSESICLRAVSTKFYTSHLANLVKPFLSFVFSQKFEKMHCTHCVRASVWRTRNLFGSILLWATNGTCVCLAATWRCKLPY